MDLISVIKKASMDAVTASKPVAIVYGIVMSASPLRIQIDQKFTIDMDFLVLTQSVTDHTVEMTVDHSTEEASMHTHEIKGRKTFTVHKALRAGDKVLMLRAQGGQKYIVVDKVVDI